MLASGPEPAPQPQRAAPPQLRPSFREGRFWLGLRAALVALQVACLTVIGWIGATLTLLPLALRGAPAARRVWLRRSITVRLLDARPREALPR